MKTEFDIMPVIWSYDVVLLVVFQLVRNDFETTFLLAFLNFFHNKLVFNVFYSSCDERFLHL